jgi:hypothetical protein
LLTSRCGGGAEKSVAIAIFRDTISNLISIDWLILAHLDSARFNLSSYINDSEFWIVSAGGAHGKSLVSDSSLGVIQNKGHPADGSAF